MSTGDTQSIAELYALLSTCFQTPDRALVDAATNGALYEQLVDRTEAMGFRPGRPPTDGFDGVPELHEAYLRSFEGFEGAYAPPAESAYEQWWDGRDGGLLSGPAAADMRRRFDAVEVDVPDRYPADHVALLLEYGSLLFETGETEAYASFHEEHFDWIPDFHERVEETCEDPFYVWTVQILSGVIEGVETQLLRADSPDGRDG